MPDMQPHVTKQLTPAVSSILGHWADPREVGILMMQ